MKELRVVTKAKINKISRFTSYGVALKQTMLYLNDLF